MKTKNLVIIFSLFLLITLASAAIVFFSKEKVEPVANEQASSAVKQTITTKATSAKPEKNTIPPAPFIKGEPLKKAETPVAAEVPAEEKTKAVMIIGGVKFEAAVKLGSTAYDAMNILKQENKINFSGKNYAELGFFVEEINGVKNDPAGKNWVYYVNGQPAQVGSSNYLIKINDIIEWKYEEKNF